MGRLLTLGLMLLSPLAHAQEISAVCKYEFTVDDQGQKSGTSGDFSLKATYMLPPGQPLNVQVRTTKAPCYEFLANGDDMRISGTCARAVQNMKMVYVYKIDRISGAFEEHFSVNDRAGIVHYGHCLPAKPLL
ncbi:hypothetical protein [Bradyrhizobium arachidis]|nr:hypothetical protein [Bradyrhizobium arachidis]SFV01106.1 hypothetical protein SAMN05192541_109300 [Bradyrhizobium arachidis]